MQRALKWAKYLPEFGWKPHLLTAKNPSVPLVDESLAEEIPTGLPILRTRTFEPPYKLKRSAWHRTESLERGGAPGFVSRLAKGVRNLAQDLLVPDPQIGWWPTAWRAAVRWIRREKMHALLVSAPPFSTLLLGKKVAEKTGIQWVADFRDEWVEFYTRAYDFHRRPGRAEKIEGMERSVMESASAVVTVTDGILQNYRRKYPNLDAGNSFWIPNGFDSEDFEGLEPPPADPGRFTLTYAGTVFEVTSARPFLAGLRTLLQRRPELSALLRVRFLGRIDPRETEPFEDPIVRDVVERTGYLPHREAVRAIRSSDALLMLLGNIPGAERILTGKIFEYLAARKPILAVVPDGEIQRLIRTERAGTVVHPRDPTAIAVALERMIEAWKRGDRPVPDVDIARFSRRETAGALARVLTSLSAS